MNPIIRLQIEQGITLRHVTPKSTEPPNLKEAKLDATTLEGVKRSNDVTLNKLNEPKKTSHHKKINSKASHIGNDINKSIDSTSGNTNLLKAASSSSEINKQTFKEKAVSASSQSPLVSDAMSMREKTQSQLEEVIYKKLKATESLFMAKKEMHLIAAAAAEILTNKMEVITGKDWDGDIDSVDHPQKEQLIPMTKTLEGWHSLKDDLKSEIDNLKSEINDASNNQSEINDAPPEQCTNQYSIVQSLLEETKAYDQVIMMDGKPASILEHGIEVSPGVFTGGSKVYLEKLTTELDEMQATFPFLKNTTSTSSIKEKESNSEDKSSGKLSEEITQKVSNHKSSSNETAATIKKDHKESDLARKSYTAKAESNQKARELDKKVVREEEDSKRIKKENIAKQKLKNEQA